MSNPLGGRLGFPLDGDEAAIGAVEDWLRLKMKWWRTKFENEVGSDCERDACTYRERRSGMQVIGSMPSVERPV